LAWDFETPPELQEKLNWMDSFVREEIEPLETLNLSYEKLCEIVAPLIQEVKARSLYAAHLPPRYGGSGSSQIQLALMHEILGRSFIAPLVFGNNAPDSGNAELLAIAIEQTGREDQKEKWLMPLLEGKLHSGFSMTEPDVAGSDPKLIKTTAVKDGDEWVINGHKWFTSNGSIADFLIVMARTEQNAPAHSSMSMILVPIDTPGVKVIRDVPTMEHPYESFGKFGNHAEIIYENVRVPYENLIGIRGEGFKLAQARLGPGRIHHAMRWIGQCNRAFEMMCERAVSRFAHGSTLSEKQMVQDWIAESATEIQAAKLLTLYAAYQMDKNGPFAARVEISMIKYWGARVLFNVIDRAIQVHGALGYTTDLPLEHMYRAARAARIYDGPDEIHKVTIAKQILKKYEPKEIPTEYIPARREKAFEKFRKYLEDATSNL
jgi:acyl-CoA dehydrogenase